MTSPPRRNAQRDLEAFLQQLRRPQQTPQEKAKERLRARLYTEIEAMFPEVPEEDGERGFARAQRIANRARLVESMSSLMGRADSGGFKFHYKLEPEQVGIMQRHGFTLYRRAGKPTTRIYFPDTSESLLRHSMNGKPWELVAPVGSGVPEQS